MGIFPKDDRPRFVDPPAWTKEAMNHPRMRERECRKSFKDMMLGDWEMSALYTREQIEQMLGRGEISEKHARELLEMAKTEDILRRQRRYMEELNVKGIFPPCIMGDPATMDDCNHVFIEAKDMRGTPVKLCQNCGFYRITETNFKLPIDQHWSRNCSNSIPSESNLTR